MRNDLEKQNLFLEEIDLVKLVDENNLSELPAVLKEAPILLIRPPREPVGKEMKAEFEVAAPEARGVSIPLIFLFQEDEPIASAGASIYVP
jgi:hypothetical protein